MSILGTFLSQLIKRDILSDFHTAADFSSHFADNVYFRFQPEYTDRFIIESLGDRDTYGYLYDENGLLIQNNDDGGTGNNFLLDQTLTAGTVYLVEARFFGNNNTGELTVAVSHAHEHAFGDWSTVREPTCTEPGLEHRLCTVCASEETQELPATGHDYVHESGELWNSIYQCRRCGARHGGADDVQEIQVGQVQAEIFRPSGEAWLRFTPEEADGYALSLSNGNYYYCTLYDSDGRLVAQVHDSGANGFRLFQYLRAGQTYYTKFLSPLAIAH